MSEYNDDNFDEYGEHLGAAEQDFTDEELDRLEREQIEQDNDGFALLDQMDAILGRMTDLSEKENVIKGALTALNKMYGNGSIFHLHVLQLLALNLIDQGRTREASDVFVAYYFEMEQYVPEMHARLIEAVTQLTKYDTRKALICCRSMVHLLLEAYAKKKHLLQASRLLEDLQLVSRDRSSNLMLQYLKQQCAA